MRETWVQSLGWEDLLEKEMAPHSSILAWKVPRCCPYPSKLRFCPVEKWSRAGLCAVSDVAAVPVLPACTIEGSFLWSSALPLICFMHMTEVRGEEPV